MTTLLELRENLKNFYNKYEIYITPVLKFLLALISLVTINLNVGYMSKLANPVIILVVALMCSFLPTSFIVLISSVYIVMNFYALSLECAVVALCLFLIMFLLYFRFTPKDALVVLLLPIAFALKIPYVVVLAAGLIGTPVSIVAAACGVIVYYLIQFVSTNANTIASLEVDNAIGKFRFVVDGMMNNKQMMVVIVAFAITILIVYLLRRMSVDHAWTIAMVAGCVTNVIVLLIGDLMFDTAISVVGVIIGMVVSFGLCKVLEFFTFNVDYTRTEYVQFEDDEYYYYVKAIPKNSVTKSKKTVKKITSVIDYRD
ncbi:MAG: hypothetical protein IIV45_00830 [Lachnospiraceae bacterium]|nr:hypothetical protein [Lachnospiraceae bacterium]